MKYYCKTIILSVLIYFCFYTNLGYTKEKTSDDALLATGIKGEAEIQQAGTNKWVPLQLGVEIHSKDKVRTGENSQLIIGSSFTVYQLEPNSELLAIQIVCNEIEKTGFAGIKSKTKSWNHEYYLKKGEAFVQVKPNQKDSHLKIETEMAILEVVGTFFNVKHVPKIKTDINVGQGEVWIKHKIKDEDIHMAEGTHVLITPEKGFSEKRAMKPETYVEMRNTMKTLSGIQTALTNASLPQGLYQNNRIVEFRQNNFMVAQEGGVKSQAQDWANINNVSNLSQTSSSFTGSVLNTQTLSQFNANSLMTTPLPGGTLTGGSTPISTFTGGSPGGGVVTGPGFSPSPSPSPGPSPGPAPPPAIPTYKPGIGPLPGSNSPLEGSRDDATGREIPGGGFYDHGKGQQENISRPGDREPFEPPGKGGIQGKGNH